MRYSDAGVDISRSDAIKDEVIAEIRSTWGDTVRPLVGGFAGVMRYPGAAPMIAATMDGVGTKLHLAMRAGRLTPRDDNDPARGLSPRTSVSVTDVGLPD